MELGREIAMPAKAKILVAEDNAALGTVIKFNLERASYEVDVAKNGRLALEAATSKLFDLIISDQQMPEMNGSEFCKRVRELPSYSHVPIILVTAKGLELDLEQLRQELGINAVFPKPFSPSQILSKVEECLATVF